MMMSLPSNHFNFFSAPYPPPTHFLRCCFQCNGELVSHTLAYLLARQESVIILLLIYCTQILCIYWCDLCVAFQHSFLVVRSYFRSQRVRMCLLIGPSIYYFLQNMGSAPIFRWKFAYHLFKAPRGTHCWSV